MKLPNAECQSIVLRLRREFDGKYSTDVELHDSDDKTKEVIPVTEHRNLSAAVEALVSAAHSVEIAINRSKLVVSRP